MKTTTEELLLAAKVREIAVELRAQAAQASTSGARTAETFAARQSMKNSTPLTDFVPAAIAELRAISAQITAIP